jgi:hypothetical protein
LERLRQFAISSNVTSGGGLRKAFGGGSVFSIPETKRQRPSFGGSVSYPFDLALTDAGATFTGVFRPGTVNGLIPSNYLSLTGISKEDTVYIGIVCTLSNAAVQTAVFAAGASPPPAYQVTKNIPPTDLSILTHVVVAGAVYRVLGPSSITVTPVASFATDKTTTLVPGETAQDTWYTYEVTS